MADEMTTTEVAPAKEQDVLISTEESKVDGVDHNDKINKALDAAAKAMVASGMSEGDAAAYLNAARPNGVSTLTGNYADLQRMTGLPEKVIPTKTTVNEDRLAFAHKLDKDAPTPPSKTF